MSNKPKLDGSCMYCGGHIQYDDVAYSMICPLCGSYLKIAEFEREQNRLKEAQQQRDEAERRYEQADMTRKDAEERLKFTLLNLEKITDSQLSEQEATERILSEQKNGNRQLDVIRLNQQEIRDLVVSVRNGQTYENDQLDGLQRSQNAITNLVQTLLTGQTVHTGKTDELRSLILEISSTQEKADDRLRAIIGFVEAIQENQGKTDKQLGDARAEISGLLCDLHMRAKKQDEFMTHFMQWAQAANAQDQERLKAIGQATDEIKSVQGELLEAVDELKQKLTETADEVKSLSVLYRTDRYHKSHLLYQEAVWNQEKCYFDEANKKFDELQIHDPQAADDLDIYWRRFLCRHGIVFECKEEDGKKEIVPSMYQPDLDDAQNIYEYDSLMKKIESEEMENKEIAQFYLAMIRKINDILDGYRRVNEDNRYDVFISVKQSNNGYMTEDYKRGIAIYDSLTQMGLKVFNSEKSPIPLGQEYEPYIFSALNSARIMLLIGSKIEYIESKWVKNEWTRFNWWMKKDKETKGSTERKILCYLFNGMSFDDLPPAIKSKQHIKEGYDSSKKLEDFFRNEFGLNVSREKTSELPEQSDEEKMANLILKEQFAEAIVVFNKAPVATPQLCILRLCATHKVVNICELVNSNIRLKNEGYFKSALDLCGRDQEKKDELLEYQRQNEAYIASHIVAPTVIPPVAPSLVDLQKIKRSLDTIAADEIITKESAIENFPETIRKLDERMGQLDMIKAELAKVEGRDKAEAEQMLERVLDLRTLTGEKKRSVTKRIVKITELCEAVVNSLRNTKPVSSESRVNVLQNLEHCRKNLIRLGKNGTQLFVECEDLIAKYKR